MAKKNSCNLVSVLGSLKRHRQGGDLPTVAFGADWRTKVKDKQFVKDFTVKCEFLAHMYKHQKCPVKVQVFEKF